MQTEISWHLETATIFKLDDGQAAVWVLELAESVNIFWWMFRTIIADR